MSSDETPIDPAAQEAELSTPLETELLSTPLPLLPPAGFAERVLAARSGDRSFQPAAQSRARRVLAVAAAAVLLGGLGVRALLGNATGTAHPSARESISLGGRGVAVAEEGADLDWRVRQGRAEIEQRAGNIFYRVERGGPFVVHTPAGAVEVQGTCFRVEVVTMKIGKQGIIGAGVGAALAATVVVSVYEGRVVYANEHGKLVLTAGDRASGARDRAPAPLGQSEATSPAGPAASALSKEALVARAEAQERELATLRARVRSFEAGSPDPAASGAASSADNRNYINPSKEDLQQLAQECKLRWDEPKISVSPSTVDATQAAELGLSETERQAMNQVNAELNTKMVAELRRLYVEVTGDTAGADGLSPGSLIEEIEQKSPRADVQAAFQRISRERAGLQQTPADPRGLSPVERLMRLRAFSGDRYERELGAAIGPDLAHQLREKHGGWSSRHSSSYGCPEGR